MVAAHAADRRRILLYFKQRPLCFAAVVRTGAWSCSPSGLRLVRARAHTVRVHPPSEYIWRCATLHRCCMVERISVHNHLRHGRDRARLGSRTTGSRAAPTIMHVPALYNSVARP
jgi:hypothetical protein